MAERQALYFLALPRTRQQNLRRQGAVFTHTQIVQSSGRAAAAGRHYGWAKRHGAWGILSSAVLTCGEGEGGDGDRPQDRGLILQHPPIRYELQGPGRRPL